MFQTSYIAINQNNQVVSLFVDLKLILKIDK